MQGRLLLLILLLWGRGVSAPKLGLLLIFDSDRSQDAIRHRQLVELLKQQRALGHFGGTSIDPNFMVFNVAESGHRRTLQTLGFKDYRQPVISLTQMHSSQVRPVSFTWRYAYASPQDALKALDQKLGLGPLPSPSPTPSPSLSPEPYPSFSPSPSATPTLSPDRIVGGMTLAPGAALISPNGLYRFVLGSDGNAQIFRQEATQVSIWQTGSQGECCKLLLTPRGKLRLLDEAGNVPWETGQDGPYADYHLQMQDDGNLVIYRRLGPDQFEPHWASQREGAPR